MQRYNSLIERMELNQRDKAKDLSSGLAAKLKVAATLARKAELYMLDESLNGIYVLVMGIFVLVLAYVSITLSATFLANKALSLVI